ncbi:MAG: NfeD family protein [Chloracidobacterium sp.]|nr:NfeD family protein [Chloracidobacterium sp.]MDW8218492.1 NfeD family protein [Acidobacteriota bacterium]
MTVAAACAAVEVFTISFIALWFAVGAGAAALAAALGFGVPVQILTFMVVSTALTVSTRRIFLRWLNRPVADTLPSNDISLIGKRGVVITESRGPRSEAELELDGTVWTALPVNGEPLTTGDECEVIRIEGNQLYVRPIQHIPDWKAVKQLN